ncbi:MAG: helix-hairpin-helix domain-containing protein [Salinivirgaceae bacterium]|nr:helix-hairpin-helix domain-containing protein [Salinivirgaceae bacterium]
MSSFWKDINSYTQGQKRALIFIWIIIILVVIFNTVHERHLQKETTNPVLDTVLTKIANDKYITKKEIEIIEIKEIFNPNIDTKEIMIEKGVPPKIANNIFKLSTAGKTYRTPEDLKTIYGMTDSIFQIIEPYINIPPTETIQKTEKRITNYRKFNPNTTTSKELIEMGFSEKVTKNIINYRKSGATFENPSDIQKLYSIDSTLYNEILAYIDIPPKEVKLEIKIVELNTSTAQEISKSTNIDLNMAYKIINYRDRLGGFLNYEQLNNIEILTPETIEKITSNTWIDTLQIKKLSLNGVEYKELIRHPYATKEITDKIMRYKKFTEKINSEADLIKNRVVNKQEIKRLRPYISYE